MVFAQTGACSGAQTAADYSSAGFARAASSTEATRLESKNTQNQREVMSKGAGISVSTMTQQPLNLFNTRGLQPERVLCSSESSPLPNIYSVVQPSMSRSRPRLCQEAEDRQQQQHGWLAGSQPVFSTNQCKNHTSHIPLSVLSSVLIYISVKKITKSTEKKCKKTRVSVALRVILAAIKHF